MSSKIRLGLVGLNFGSWIIENELLAGAGREYIDLVAVCDLDAAKTAAWSARLGVKGYTDFARLLEDPQVEAVGLFTGPVGRAGLIDRAITAGRDVITTKPFELDSAQAGAVLTKAARLGRVVHLNSPSPRMPADLAVLAGWVEEFHLGRPVAYRATTWCSYREQPDGSWYDDPELCPAAPIFRLGIYLINDVSWFFRGVQDVQVFQSRLFTGRPTPDNAQLSILYADGSIGSIFSSFCIDDRQFYRCALEMNFERGTVTRNLGVLDANLTAGMSALALSAGVNGEQVTRRCQVKSAGAGYQWDVFYRAVRGERLDGLLAGSEMIVSAIRTIEMMQARLRRD